MVLQAPDELRHEPNDDFYWRESLYFNFNDPVNEIGAWIYLWVVPNQPLPSGMLVSFYHGRWPDLSINDAAMASPGHRIVDGDRWAYCFKQDVEHLIDADFDDVELSGLRLRRTHPLGRYLLDFDDGEGSSFSLTARFMTPPFDYADGCNPTPSWVAANRYHRSWWGKGSLTICGTTYDIDVTGDSDHSWGQRHTGVFAENLFKMWSFQRRDGELSVSAIQQGPEGEETALGFVDLEGRLASVRTISQTASYDELGVQRGVDLTVTDELDRAVKATFAEMHSHIGSGAPDRLWGYEGVGTYDVDGYGETPGLISYFWPPAKAPAALVERHR